MSPVLVSGSREQQGVPAFADVAVEMVLESRLDVGGYGDGADAGFRLGPADDLEPVDANHRSPDVDCPSLEVDVAAAQFEDLPEPEGAPRCEQDCGLQVVLGRGD